MRYTLAGFQQDVLLGLECQKEIKRDGKVVKTITQTIDGNDIFILRWLLDFHSSDMMLKKLIDGEEYFWVYYDSIRAELPILRLTSREAIIERFHKYIRMGILILKIERGFDVYIHRGREKDRHGVYSYYRFNPAMLRKLLRADDKLKDYGKSKPTKAKAKAVVKPTRLHRREEELPAGAHDFVYFWWECSCGQDFVGTETQCPQCKSEINYE